MHLHHLVSFHSDKENCNTLTESSTSDVYPVSGYIVLESSRHQAAIPFAARAAEKAGWIITTVVSLSFHFCLSLEAVFYLRVLLSQNPVEPITAPYEIVKVYRFGRRRCPTTFPIPANSRQRILSAHGIGSLAVHRERYVPQPYLPPCHRLLRNVTLSMAEGTGRDKKDRTFDLTIINHVLYQLSYIPELRQTHPP